MVSSDLAALMTAYKPDTMISTQDIEMLLLVFPLSYQHVCSFFVLTAFCNFVNFLNYLFPEFAT